MHKNVYSDSLKCVCFVQPTCIEEYYLFNYLFIYLFSYIPLPFNKFQCLHVQFSQ